jgi:hypothetical protein
LMRPIIWSPLFFSLRACEPDVIVHQRWPESSPACLVTSDASVRSRARSRAPLD